jgi:hypothetical protein
MSELTTTREIMDILGGDKSVGKLTGRTRKAANNWRAFNRFPPDTYVAIQCALKNLGHSAPAALWRMAQCHEDEGVSLTT